MATHAEILLVTPVWNDSTRLARFGPTLAHALSESKLSVRWVIADDGSSEDELKRIQQLIGDFTAVYSDVDLVRCAKRYRKGGAIYQAWDQNSDAKWFAFVDADGAIDASTVVDLLQQASRQDRNTGIIGVRQDSSETPVARPIGRALSFKLFTWMVQCLLGKKYSDTQCGLKVVPADAYRAVASQLVERGFVFDVELLIAIVESGSKIEEVPIPWSEMPGGKVHPLRDAWAMLGGLLNIRGRLRSGQYKTAP